MLTQLEMLLLADAAIIKLIFIAVVVIIWLFNNLVGDKNKLAKNKPQQRPQGPTPEAKPAPPQLANEIEEFLKRAGQKRREKTQRKPKPAVVAKPAPPPKPARRLVPRASEEQSFEISTTQNIADQVQQHLDTRRFAERADHMIDDLARADAEREAHHRQMFDHKLGRLTDTSAAQSEQQTQREGAEQLAAVAAAAGGTATIAALLANPQSVKQAIVLNEILSRPEHRW